MPNRRIGDEYPLKSGIIIALKRNPSGSKAYRVDIPASITGKLREQRQFSTKEGAQRYARQRHEEITQFGHAAFSLSADQRHDALRAYGVLREIGISLEQAARIAATHRPKSKEQLTLRELRQKFLSAPGRRKSKAMQRRKLTLENLGWRTARLERAFGGRVAADIDVDEIKQWFSSLGSLSPVSLNNYRRAFHALFAYGVSEGFCGSNPIAKIPLFAVPVKSPTILSLDAAKRLIHCAFEMDSRNGLLGYITLGLFAGLRRAELQRLDWSAVKWERKMVTVDSSIAKTGSIRNVALSENAFAWLSFCRGRVGSVVPLNLNHRLRKLRSSSLIARWDGNELRHSFASYHYDKHQNAPLTAAQLGHSSGCQLLFEHYRSLVPLGDGELFFSIFPPTEEPAVSISPV